MTQTPAQLKAASERQALSAMKAAAQIIADRFKPLDTASIWFDPSVQKVYVDLLAAIFDMESTNEH